MEDSRGYEDNRTLRWQRESAEELGAAVCFLCSAGAGFITGHVLPHAGGHGAHLTLSCVNVPGVGTMIGRAVDHV